MPYLLGNGIFAQSCFAFRMELVLVHVRLFNHYIHTSHLWLGAVEAALHVVSAYAGVWLVAGNASLAWEGLLPKACIYSLILMLSTMAMGVNQARFKEGELGVAVRTVVSYFLLGCLLLLVLYLLIPAMSLGRGVLAPALMLSFVLVTLARRVFVLVVGEEAMRRRILLVGAGHRAKELIEAFEDGASDRGVRVVGAVPAGEAEIAVPEARLINWPGSLFEVVVKEHIDEVVVVTDGRRRRGDGGAPLPINDLLDCKLEGINVLEASTFYERETGKIEISLIQPASLVFSDGFRFSRLRDFTKRAFDLLICSLLLFLVWPLMLLTALAVWLESGCRGPILYRQCRVGLNGRHFDVCKFRSMRVDAEKDGKAVWAQKNDSRITRVGGFIRSTRLDELPQIFNVLRGEMSFVGPRPERPEFVSDLAQQIPFYDARHRVKPGLMGWAQLCYPYGASVKDAENKLKYDLYYVKNHSLLLDCLIVIQTVEVILLGKGVH